MDISGYPQKSGEPSEQILFLTALFSKQPLTYVTWKHLTNDIHLFSLDLLISGIAHAETIFREALHQFQGARSYRNTSRSLAKVRSKSRSPDVKRRAA